MATIKHPAFGTTRTVPDDQADKWAEAGWKTDSIPEDAAAEDDAQPGLPESPWQPNG